MPSNLVNSFMQKSGKSKADVESAYNDAKKEAKAMGQADNYDYITDIWKKMLDISESVEKNFYKRLTTKFVNSKERNFINFYEETMISSEIDKDVRPETIKKKKKDEEEEEIKNIDKK